MIVLGAFACGFILGIVLTVGCLAIVGMNRSEENGEL